MIWKIFTGLLSAGLISALLYYNKDLRFWVGKSDTLVTKQQQTIDQLQNKLSVAQRSLAVSAESLDRMQREADRQADQQAALLPTIQVQVARQTAMQQRVAILEKLVADGLLKPADTIHTEKVVWYSEPQQTAISIASRLCDSLQQKYYISERGRLAIQEAYRLQKIAMDTTRTWIAEGKLIARKKGIFTGKNKELRQHSLSPPI